MNPTTNRAVAAAVAAVAVALCRAMAGTRRRQSSRGLLSTDDVLARLVAIDDSMALARAAWFAEQRQSAHFLCG